MTAPAYSLADLSDLLFLTVPEAASILRADPRTLRRAIEAGDITVIKIYGVVRIPTRQFLAEVGLSQAAIDTTTALDSDDRPTEADPDVLHFGGRRAPPDNSAA